MCDSFSRECNKQKRKHTGCDFKLSFTGENLDQKIKAPTPTPPPVLFPPPRSLLGHLQLPLVPLAPGGGEVGALRLLLLQCRADSRCCFSCAISWMRLNPVSVDLFASFGSISSLKEVSEARAEGCSCRKPAPSRQDENHECSEDCFHTETNQLG